MRRFVFLLIAVLLLQFNWIAAASACTHEAGAGARHFGHHQHEHKAADAKFGDKASSGGALADDDCAVCHLGCGAASPPGSLRVHLLSADAPAIAPSPMIRAAWPDPPDRPRWSTAS